MLALAGLIGTRSPLVAQSGGDPGGIRLGVVQIRPTLTLSQIGADGNVYNDSVDPKTDFTTTFSPRADVAVRLGRTRLTGSTAWDLRYYRTYSDQGGVNSSYNIRVDGPPGRVTPYISGALRRTFDRQGLDIHVRAHRSEYDGLVGTEVRLSSKLSFDLSAQQSGRAFGENDEFRGLNLDDELRRTLRHISYGAHFDLTPLTRLSVNAIQEDTAFKSSPERDSSGFRVVSAVEFQPFALIGGAARVGVLRFRPNDPRQPTFVGPVAALNLFYNFRGSTRLTLTLDRDVGYSADAAQTSHLQTSIGVGLFQQLNSSLYAGVTGLAQSLNTRPLQPSGIPLFPGGSQSGQLLGATVGYRLTSAIRVGLNVDHAKRYGVPRESYDSLRIYGSLYYSVP